MHKGCVKRLDEAIRIEGKVAIFSIVYVEQSGVAPTCSEWHSASKQMKSSCIEPTK